MNLLLVTVDSLRLDHAPRLGGELPAPACSAQLAGFAAFAGCFSVSSATRPVHASLLSGLYPFEHGVRGQRTAAMRPGVAELLTFLGTQGWRVCACSEAPAVFTGLPFAALLEPLAAAPEPGLQHLRARVRALPDGRAALFVHYWSAHTPYGAADGQASGTVGRLLAAGRLRQVRERYAAAVVQTLERKLAPLLAELDRDRWAMVVCSDHGESWTPEEPYHGQTLRNSVLRVPLYLHLPGVPPGAYHGLAAAATPVSLVDVAPTVVRYLGIPFPNRCAGRGLLSPADPRVCLAEIEPCDSPDLVQAAPGTAPRVAAAEPCNCVLDSRYKLTEFERTGRRILEHSWTELPAADAVAADRLLAARAALRAASPYGLGQPAAVARPDAAIAGDPLLDQRLRDLGYLG